VPLCEPRYVAQLKTFIFCGSSRLRLYLRIPYPERKVVFRAPFSGLCWLDGTCFEFPSITTVLNIFKPSNCV
jgi:hypothetical protein